MIYDSLLFTELYGARSHVDDRARARAKRCGHVQAATQSHGLAYPKYRAMMAPAESPNAAIRSGSSRHSGWAAFCKQHRISEESWLLGDGVNARPLGE